MANRKPSTNYLTLRKCSHHLQVGSDFGNGMLETKMQKSIIIGKSDGNSKFPEPTPSKIAINESTRLYKFCDRLTSSICHTISTLFKFSHHSIS